MKPSSLYSLLKFFSSISQLCHSLVVHPPKKNNPGSAPVKLFSSAKLGNFTLMMLHLKIIVLVPGQFLSFSFNKKIKIQDEEL